VAIELSDQKLIRSKQKKLAMRGRKRNGKRNDRALAAGESVKAAPAF
jgi:hypothetical protein